LDFFSSFIASVDLMVSATTSVLAFTVVSAEDVVEGVAASTVAVVPVFWF
jgi:hypothetical protein